MIKPTVGRVVLFNAGEDQPYAASIAYVHDDYLINIGGIDARGVPFNEQNVMLIQDSDINAKEGEAYWMPYQQAQAEKNNLMKEIVDNAVLSGRSFARVEVVDPVDVFEDVENTGVGVGTVNRNLASHQINQPMQ